MRWGFLENASGGKFVPDMISISWEIGLVNDSTMPFDTKKLIYYSVARRYDSSGMANLPIPPSAVCLNKGKGAGLYQFIETTVSLATSAPFPAYKSTRETFLRT